MGISDSVPERRNLVVLSVAIILYFLGGGTVSGSGLKLPMVNVEFTRLWVLVLAMWVALAWFFFRYWQTWRADGKNQIREDVESFPDAPQLLNYVEKNSKISPNQRERFIIRGIVVGAPQRTIQFDKHITHKTEGNKLKELPSPQAENGLGMDVKGADGKRLMAGLYLRALVFRQGIISYYTPYLLAVLAAALGLAHTL